MGIYIYREIAPTKIDKKAWEKTYEDTLKLVSYGQLAECEYKYINGMKGSYHLTVCLRYISHCIRERRSSQCFGTKCLIS